MTTRRQFLAGGVALVGATLAERASAAPDIQSRASAETASPLWLSSGKPYQPVVTPNGWTLAPTLKDGVKEFHLVAEPVKREFAPGMTVNCWGYNGSTLGPTLEAVEGERVRIYVTNRLPEHTTIHWHGIRVPNGMDGVGGLTQPHIPPGKTFVYEFVLKRSGTFMYHPHSDDMLQVAMGMMGFFIVHPKNAKERPVDRDFCIMLHNWDVEAGTATPKASTMTEFNLWSFNSRVFPGTAPLVVRKNDRVRIRIGNLSMHDHPIHLHGYDFWATGTDGGWIPKSAQLPEITVNVPVGAMRAIEFVADEPGDWAFHCHKMHHVMGPMGHNVPNMLGVDQRGIAGKIGQLVDGYMAMGESGMSEMQEMQMPLPENTLPMMTGDGPFGPLEMGGMFTVVKVREGLAHNDYRDPGWYRHPSGTVAWEDKA
ncbi:MAG: multicopper oxidase family protein [Methylophilaceae bacterium]|jgi:FtsP/CotA-like multicopper oxidase with cupredoxin domain|nr:copper oxidase [Methylophilaceae bacterium]